MKVFTLRLKILSRLKKLKAEKAILIKRFEKAEKFFHNPNYTEAYKKMYEEDLNQLLYEIDRVSQKIYELE